MTNEYYDPKADSDVLTTEQAAAYLGLTYEYMRQLVSDGAIKQHDNAGKTLLFSKLALNAYKVKRDGDPELKEKLDALPDKLKATVWVDIPVRKILKHKQPEIASFSWDELPKLKARLRQEYGEDMYFRVKVDSPDGSEWRIAHQPSYLLKEILNKAFKRGKKK